jgi:hypothetical protein
MSDFTERSNPWSYYVLPDGRQMRVRHILTDVVQVGIDPDGLPKYNVTFQPVIAIEPTLEQIDRTAKLIQSNEDNAVSKHENSQLRISKNDLQ